MEQQVRGADGQGDFMPLTVSQPVGEGLWAWLSVVAVMVADFLPQAAALQLKITAGEKEMGENRVYMCGYRSYPELVMAISMVLTASLNLKPCWDVQTSLTDLIVLSDAVYKHGLKYISISMANKCISHPGVIQWSPKCIGTPRSTRSVIVILGRVINTKLYIF